jgi:hypothetical protein
MFVLAFFELVRRIMLWTHSPEMKFMNIQEKIAQAENKATTNPVRDMWKHAMPGEKEFHDYIKKTYPPYFGVYMRVGRAAILCNHTLLEHY